MLSGASSSAPRWSVVGLTGNATPCSRGEQLAAAAGRDGRDDGEQQEARPWRSAAARSDVEGVGRVAGAGQERRESRRGQGERAASRARPPQGGPAADRRGPEAQQVSRRRATGSPAAARTRCGAGPALSRGERGRHAPPPPRHLVGGDGRRPASRRAAPAPRRRPRRELAQVGGDQDAGAAGAGVGDRRRGSPRRRSGRRRRRARRGAARCGLVEGGQHDRQPPAHAVAEAAGDPVGGVAELEPLEQVAGALLPARSAGAAGPTSWRCSQAVARGTRPPTSGQ